jgi:hypothetical protein
MTTPSPAEVAALGYVRRGWRLVPIPAGHKRPMLAGWQHFLMTPEDVPQLFGHGENVAAILGPLSGEIRDIDLDCPEAVALADLYLPTTSADSAGRRSPDRTGSMSHPARSTRASPTRETTTSRRCSNSGRRDATAAPI